jgi:hypothetical protein
MKKAEKTILPIFFLLLILVIFLFFQYLSTYNKEKEKKNKLVSSSTPTPTFIRRPEDLPIIKKDEATNKEIIEIPFNYVVKSVSEEKIVLQKPGGSEQDIITYPKDIFNVIKVFKSSPQGETPASLSDIAVGQRIKVRNINRGEEIQFYIIE